MALEATAVILGAGTPIVVVLGATRELDNLQNTAVNADINPAVDLGVDIGSPAKRFAEIHAAKVFAVEVVSGGTATLSNAGFLGGKVDATGTLQAIQLGSFASGYAKGNGGAAEISAITKNGTFAMGYAFNQGVGQTAKLIASGGGSFAQGYVGNPLGYNTNASSKIQSGSFGSLAQGWAGAGYYDNSGASPTFEIEVTSDGWGGFAQGISYGAYGNETRIKVSEKGGFAQGYAGATTGANGKGHIYVTAYGGFAQGWADGNGGTAEIKVSGRGGFAQGAITNNSGTKQLLASGDGSFAVGNVVNVNLIASGIGSFAGGRAATNDILASGAGAFAWGDSTTGLIEAAAANAFQFGVGSNSIANSFQIGLGVNFRSLGSMFLKEQAAAAVDVPGWGQLWCKDNAGTTELWFTNDVGLDTQIV